MMYDTICTCADSEGGGGVPGPPPPRDLSEVGSCMDVWSKGEWSKCGFILLSLFSGSLCTLAGSIHK